MAEVHADTREYLLVHESLRRTLATFVGATERLDPDALAAIIGPRWALFARALHHHHEGEDTVFFPLIVRDRPDADALVARLEAEHRDLEPALAAVDGAITALTTRPGAPTRTALHDAIVAVHDLLVPHLDVEDAELLPLAAESVDGAEWKKVSEAQMRSVLKADLPVVAGALDELARSLPQAQRPAPPPLIVRLLVAVSWRRRYRKFVDPLRAGTA